MGGINVAEGDDKPTSKDLGTIRPPGGTPLPLEEPGKSGIKVELLNKVRERLEAAPAEDLDNWVVVLERITGTKLDGDCKTGMPHLFRDSNERGLPRSRVEREGCRQPFRAQTIPAAEAKVWKESFEALLKKEIRQRSVPARTVQGRYRDKEEVRAKGRLTNRCSRPGRYYGLSRHDGR